MSDAREASRWEASWALAVGVIAGLTLIALAPAMASSLFDHSTVLGLPTSYFLTGILVPVLIVVAIFWFAQAQDRLDRRFDGS